jgi:hypothetical protein
MHNDIAANPFVFGEMPGSTNEICSPTDGPPVHEASIALPNGRYQ